MRITMKGARLRLTVQRVDWNPRRMYNLVGTLLIVPGASIGGYILDDCEIYTDIDTECRKQPDNPILINIPVYYSEDMLAITADNTKGHIFVGNMVWRQRGVNYLSGNEDLRGLSQDRLLSEVSAMMHSEIEEYAHFLRGTVFEMTVRYRQRSVATEQGGWSHLYHSEKIYGTDPETNGMLDGLRRVPRVYSICMDLAKSVMHELANSLSTDGYLMQCSMRESQYEESVCE